MRARTLLSRGILNRGCVWHVSQVKMLAMFVDYSREKYMADVIFFGSTVGSHQISNEVRRNVSALAVLLLTSSSIDAKLWLWKSSTQANAAAIVCNKVIWLYQLSWKCKLGTVTSWKADVSSVSLSSERMTSAIQLVTVVNLHFQLSWYNQITLLPPPTQHHSFIRNFHPYYII